MDLSGKLQIKPGTTVGVHHQPRDVDIDLGDGVTVTAGDSSDAVILFARTKADLTAHGGPVVAAARADKLAWVAYPKAGKLGTDLNRDSLNAAMNDNGVQAVRQVSIDDVWSALRFRPL